MRVLLIDDDARLAELLVAYLAPQGVAYVSYNAYPGGYFRDMVRAFHEEGIKVIVDIVTNHMGQMFFYDINNNGRPDEFLGGPAKAEWGYVVFTTGADVDQRFTLLGDLSFGGPDDGLFVLPAKPGGAADRFGGQRDDDLGLSPIVDLLVPRDTTQERVLADYARDGSRLVALPGVVPAAKTP